MSWANIIFYATAQDADLLRRYINDDPEAYWITKLAENGSTYTWRAVGHLSELPEQRHAIWRPESGPLTVPSGSRTQADALVADPFSGWTQVIATAGLTCPWFGGNYSPVFLDLHHSGCEALGSIARSEFTWAADHFRLVGLPSSPGAKRWWRRLTRFIADNSLAESWPPGTSSRRKAYVFPEAHAKVLSGRTLDVNPWRPR